MHDATYLLAYLAGIANFSLESFKMNSAEDFFAVSLNIGQFHAEHIIFTISVFAGSRFVKNLRSYSTGKLIDYLVTISLILVKYMRLQGQRQRHLSCMAQQTTWASPYFMLISWDQILSRYYEKGQMILVHVVVLESFS